MNLKETAPKAYREFEEWLKNFIHHLPVRYILTTHGSMENILKQFGKLPFEMQCFVYMKYLDEMGLVVVVGYFDTYKYLIWKKKGGKMVRRLEVKKLEFSPKFETSEEAYKQAIEQAFKIKESQLNK